jgi:hypothetical protein
MTDTRLPPRTFILREDAHLRALTAHVAANWQACAGAGQPLAVTVLPHKAQRTRQQNRLYWAYVREIAENAWVDGQKFTPEAWHEYLKRKLIGHEDLPHGGTCGISTATLDVAQFNEFIGGVAAYAAENGYLGENHEYAA